MPKSKTYDSTKEKREKGEEIPMPVLRSYGDPNPAAEEVKKSQKGRKEEKRRPI